VELNKFKELEDKIKNLLAEYSSVKKRNQQLEDLLKNKAAELEEANNKIRGLVEEKDSVRVKVDTLLKLLQDAGASQ
jgi:uncharacterized coiled-coil DUF342 family protein